METLIAQRTLEMFELGTGWGKARLVEVVVRLSDIIIARVEGV